MACDALTSGACSCGFHIALAEFKSTLQDDSLIKSFQGTCLHQLTSEIARIQQEQVSKRRMRYMKRVEPFLKTMEQYGKVVEIFVNVEEIVAFVWGPMKFLLITASSYNEAFDSLLNAYQDIWEQLPLLEEYASALESRPHLQTVLIWIYKDILEFHREAIGYFKHRVWKQIFQAAWRGFLPKISFIKENMARHRRLLENGATLAQLEEVNNFRRNVEREFEIQRRSELDRQRHAIITWLNPAPPSLEKYRYARAWCPGAGKWLLESQRFKDWFDPDFCRNPLLWITGIPGAGKSVLASVIVEAARDLDTDVNVAFFFCQPNDPSTSTFVAVSRGILSQLLAQNNSLITNMAEHMSLSGQVTLSTIDLAKSMLKDALGCCKNTYVVIDGLDSCSRKDRKEIVSTLRSIVESFPKEQMDDVRCVFLSQNDGFAKKDLGDLPTISITPKDNKADIGSYWTSCKNHLESRLGSLETLGIDIVKVITARAHGMFLFATLMFLHLEPLPLQKLTEELQRIPQGLDEIYERVMHNLLSHNDFQRQDRLRLLGWLACARRPLKWYEVRGAAAIDLDGQTVDYEQLVPRALRQSHRDLCGPLVEQGQDDTLQFIHLTAKDYILKHHFQDRRSHLNFSALLIPYLTLPEVHRDVNVLLLPCYINIGYYAFLEYSVTCWSLHLQEALQEKGQPSADLEEISEDLGVFIDTHWPPPRDTTANTLDIPKAVLKNLEQLQNEDFFKELCLAVTAARRHLTSQESLAKADHGPLDLTPLLMRVRETLAMLAESGNLCHDQQRLLREFYGPNWFKCSAMNCEYFHKGFLTRKQLDEHINRHEKPFMCLVPDCELGSTFGWAKKDALQTHLLEAHGIDISDPTKDLEFPLPPTKTASDPSNPSRFTCPACHKTFTRNHNLQNHLRTHRNEKPHSCAHCSQTFTRKHDRDRHQATMHSETKRFICLGDLSNGGQWGCGREFARQDKLAEHLKSKTGQKCILPLFSEEMNVDGGLQDERWNSRLAEILASRLALDPEQLRPVIMALSSFPISYVRNEGKPVVEITGASGETV
ncbi:hypothetical protein QBC40DRAFT_288802 [Triangularia verruculosa]|uniref:C2H2-type domain-containing protein n=1 Tax=Triangularia verruculosa TaxID=2587418 RepID=A0AAN6X7K5_9PEZI|nr:hypothetical protein QBC40DRAFT_288802 [Triangularia verruculosa]